MDNTASIYIKHFIKTLIGRPDPRWPLFRFEQSFRKDTVRRHDEIMQWAERCLADRNVFEDEDRYKKSADPLVRQGYELKKKTEKEFAGKYSHLKKARILIHVPDENKSPAGYSLFTNFIEAFKFLGIAVKEHGWNDSIKKNLEEFNPTVFLTSDHKLFLSKIAWDEVAHYRKNHMMLLGLTAGLEEYGNTPLAGRLDWGKKHGVDFYYSYRDKEYLDARKEYKPFHDKGLKILPLMFGANIQIYYPVPDIERDMDYIFLGSQNRTKAPRYASHMKDIVSNYFGLIDGPGWRHVKNFSFNRDRDRYLYARSKVGLNMHLEEQIEWVCEVNERTYMLAACGIPQLCDDAKLLKKLFSPDSLYIAKKPDDYLEHFKEILAHPEQAQARALKAQKEVFEKYTTFHRVEAFINELQKNFTI